MQALIELKCPANTLSALQLFYDTVEGHIRSLQSLGTPQQHYGSMLIQTILRKLPADVRKDLARSHDSEQWTWAELQKCILQEVKWEWTTNLTRATHTHLLVPLLPT